MSVFHSDLFRQQALIAGSWRDAADGTTLAVSNPSTGATLGQIPNMGRAEAQQAVDAAAAALPDWRAPCASTSRKKRTSSCQTGALSSCTRRPYSCSITENRPPSTFGSVKYCFTSCSE